MSGAGGGKRPSGGDSPPVPPEKKTKKEEKTTTTLIEPIRIAGVSSTVSVYKSTYIKHLLRTIINIYDIAYFVFFNCFCAGGNGHEGPPVQEQEAMRALGAETDDGG